jgi:hypothetical protein
MKDRFRQHMILKCATREAFAAAMGALRDVESASTPALRVTLDVDPGSML